MIAIFEVDERREIELRALLVRAAEQEARRQSAKERGDTMARWAAEREHRDCGAAMGALERCVG